MIERHLLNHGSYYRGRSRNATLARWNSDREVFVYRRHKFSETFFEEIDHPDHNRGYDVFVVSAEVENPEHEIPLNISNV